MAVTRKEQIASGKKVTPLTREELRLAGKTFAPLTEEERFQKVAYGGSGGGGAQKVALIAEQSFTGVKPQEEVQFYAAVLNGDYFSDDEIDVTYDGVHYNASLSESMTYGASFDAQAGTIDFSEYPFVIISTPEAVQIAVADANTHTVKIEAERITRDVVRISKRTVTASGAGSFITLDGVAAFGDDAITVTFDGQQYTVQNGSVEYPWYGAPRAGREDFDFSTYPFRINVDPEYGVSLVVSTAGEHNVEATAQVTAVFPDGTIVLTENGLVDVSRYRRANVQAPYVSGEITFQNSGSEVNVLGAFDLEGSSSEYPNGVYPVVSIPNGSQTVKVVLSMGSTIVKLASDATGSRIRSVSGSATLYNSDKHVLVRGDCTILIENA